jgi:predicted ATPase/DNA-binding CsgD family transcriptional regulator
VSTTQVRTGTAASQPFLLSRFVGRREELERGAELLAEYRLVTVTGAGGCGKTRLAVELARTLELNRGQRTWFADLAPVPSGEFVLGEIATAIGAEEPERGHTLAEEIVRRVEPDGGLLILDNCEHVIEAAGEAVATLLQGAPGLRVLATSREPLALPGEAAWRLGGLADADALELFVARARSARPGSRIDDRQLDLIRRACARLDGVPLAIELTAARTHALSLAQIVASLDQHLGLPGGAPRTAPLRQTTLRASFEWSYRLLADDSRAAVAQLAVFAGGFSLEDALAVCPAVSIDEIAGLVSRSLLSVSDASEAEPRYRLPAAIREFASEYLNDSATGEEVRRWHAERYVALAEAAERQLTGGDQDEWLARLRADHGNLRAALVWSRDRPAPELCARLAVALTPYWLELSQWSECRLWLEAAVAHEIPAALQACVLNRRCYLEMWAGDAASVPILAGRALALLDGLDDQVEEGRSHGFIGVAIAAALGPDSARSHLDRAFELTRASGDDWGLAMALAFGAYTAVFQAAPEKSRRMLDESIEIASAGGDRRTLRLARAFAALAAVTQGRTDEAILRSRRAVDDARAAGHETPLILGLICLSWASRLMGDHGTADATARECLAIAAESEEGQELEGLALWVLAAEVAQADPGQALALLAEARTLTAGHRVFAGLPVLAQAEILCGNGSHDVAAVAASAALERGAAAGCVWITGRARLVQARLAPDPVAAESIVHAAITDCRTAGDELGLVAAVDVLASLADGRGDHDEATRLRELETGEALAYAARGRGRRRRPATGWASLTPTETEVVRLVAQHQTNPEIAERLFISRATVKTHLVHVFAKLSVRSRSELAAEAASRGLR